MYSVPGRFVQTCLHVTEQVWQPMHLSRFITIATCAMIRISCPPPSAVSPQPGPASVLHLLGAAADHGDLVALVAGRPVVVEGERQLAVPADHVGGLDRSEEH